MRSTYSYISIRFFFGLNLFCDILNYPISMSILVRDIVFVTYVYHACFVLFMDFHTWINLIILDILDFEIILEMTRLSPCHAILTIILR